MTIPINFRTIALIVAMTGSFNAQADIPIMTFIRPYTEANQTVEILDFITLLFETVFLSNSQGSTQSPVQALLLFGNTYGMVQFGIIQSPVSEDDYEAFEIVESPKFYRAQDLTYHLYCSLFLVMQRF